MAGPKRARRIREAADPLGRPFEVAISPDSATPAAEPPDPVALARAEAAERGREEGRRRGEEEFEREVADFRKQMARTLDRLAELESAMRLRYEEVLLEIALEAASRIVRERIDSGDPVAARALREAFEHVPVGEGLRARLHPGDLDAVARELAQVIDRGGIELVEDPAVSPGGCVLDGETGTVDATLETATDLVREAARGAEDAP